MEGYLETADTLDTRQFTVAVKRLADNFSYGTDSSPFLGSGVEYVQSRRYQPGDPIRSIDWRVTARTGKYFIKEFEAPKRMPCYLLIDTSASMTITSQRLSKYALAVHIAGGIAFACLDRVSPVGVVGVGSREFRVEPSLSRDQIMRWLYDLRRFRYDESTTLSRRINELTPSLLSRTLVIVLSDFHDPSSIPALKRMAQQHDCVALQLRDPGEVDLRGAGLMRGREAETGRGFLTHGRRQHLDQKEIQQSLRSGGIDHVLVETNKPISQKLRHFFQSRHLLGKAAR